MGMDGLAFSLFSLKGQFSASITPWGRCKWIFPFPQGQKWDAFLRGVRRKAHEIHFASLQQTSTLSAGVP